MGNYFSWGGDDSSGLGEGRILLQLLPNGHVFSSCHRGFWVFSLASRQLSSSIWVQIQRYEPKTMLNSSEIVNFFIYVFFLTF